MPVLAACHLIYVFSVVLHCISVHVVANKVLSLIKFRPSDIKTDHDYDSNVVVILFQQANKTCNNNITKLGNQKDKCPSYWPLDPQSEI